MVVAVQGFDRNAVVVLDADSDEFVIVPGLPEHLSRETVSLSSDGTRLVFLARQDDGAGPMRVVLHALATGARQEFASDDFMRAALSPDGTRIAVLADLSNGPGIPGVGDEIAGITLIETATGARQPLWSAEGYWEEASISWSPDGRLLAATYLTLDDVLTTVVLDLSGKAIGVHEERVALPGPHSVWRSDRELIVYPEPDDESPLIAIDVPTGSERRFTRGNFSAYLAIAGGRVVRPGSSPERFVTTDLDDADERPFLTFHPAVSIDALDIAPSALR
ncbi:PD40 domain-containing protein [Sphaerisporangium fuscum]|uniref:PD40 domain-containing protein n=1 Tax=Sphaerisporangium fuscum TaxID=2835868 RepID=UPI001BDD4577|nr:PD40 domain-containing protein [Sphaerisporangium fuscum]